MTTSTNADWEEATHCPKCGQAGREVAKNPSRRGTVYTYLCANERCKWHNTTWIVQVKSDGTIPIRKAGMPEYPKLTNDQESMARRVLQDLEFEATRRAPGT